MSERKTGNYSTKYRCTKSNATALTRMEELMQVRLLAGLLLLVQKKTNVVQLKLVNSAFFHYVLSLWCMSHKYSTPCSYSGSRIKLYCLTKVSNFNHSLPWRLFQAFFNQFSFQKQFSAFDSAVSAAPQFLLLLNEICDAEKRVA